MGTDDAERTDRPRQMAVDESESRPDGTGGRPGDGVDDRESTDSRQTAAPMSRRSFVLASGSALGASVLGFGSGAAGDVTAVTVTATEPYRSAVSALAETGHAGHWPDVAVRSPGDDPLAALDNGDVDVHVSGRPQIVSADGGVHSTAREEFVAGRGALVHDGPEWREPVDASDLSERAEGGAPVETWSETDWRSVAAVERAAGSARAARPVVRGTRSFQYARGRGGVGYYWVDRESLRVDSDGKSADPDRATPLVRLGYAHVGRRASDDGAPPVRRLAGERSRPAVDESSYFPNHGLSTTD